MRQPEIRKFNPPGLPGLLHLVAAYTLAVAHPVYDLLSNEAHTPFFTAHNSRPVDIAVFILSFSLLPPMVIWIVAKGLNLFSARLAAVFFLGSLTVLTAIAFLPAIAPRASGSATVSLVLCGVIALILVAAYWKLSPVRSFYSFLAIAVVASPVMFLASEPVQMVFESAGSRSGHEVTVTSDRPDIVLIVFDEFPLLSLLDPKREIDRALFPNFTAFQSTATWYRNTLTTHYATTGAIASLLVGGHYSRYYARRARSPNTQSAGLNREKAPDNLFAMLEPHYRIHAIEATSKLAPESQQVKQGAPKFTARMSGLMDDALVLWLYAVLPEDLHARLPYIGAQWMGFGQEIPPPESSDHMKFVGPSKPVKQFVDLFEEDWVPTLFYLHLMLPHYPFIFSETGQVDKNRFPFINEALRTSTGENHWPHPVVASLVQQAHLVQVGFTDSLLGLIMDRLKGQGLFDSSLIVVTADHGTSFFSSGEPLDVDQLMAIQASETLQVPLFIKWPYQTEGTVIDDPAQTIDIVPTIADSIGLTPDWEVEGLSLRKTLPADRIRSAFVPDFRPLPPQPPGQQQALNRKIEVFGSQGWDRLYQIGPGRDLIGLTIEQLAAQEFSASVILHESERFEDVDLSSQRVPAYIEGEIREWPLPWPADQATIAIAVNGVIVNTTYALPFSLTELRKNKDVANPPKGHEDRWYFLARVLPSSLRDGSNEIDVLVFQETNQSQKDGGVSIYRLQPTVSDDLP